MRKTPRKGSRSPAGSVDGFMERLEHPLKSDIELARRAILEASPAVEEAVKWNAPSFRTSDFFATFNLRSTQTVQLVFHMGAKAKVTATTGVAISDPKGLVRWLSKDRCLVTLGAGSSVRANRSALGALVREWIRQLP